MSSSTPTGPEPVDLRPTLPTDCALAFGIPTTIEGFARDLGLRKAKDFAHNSAGRPRSVAYDQCAFVASSLYCAEAVGIAETVGVVASLGVNVETVLNPTGLRPLLGKYDVVTLVTHWRPASFFSDDFLDVPSFARRLRAQTDSLSVAVWNAMTVQARALLERADRVDWHELEPRQCLANELNHFLLGQETADSLLAFERREAIDLAYPHAFMPGNRVEFGGGLHAIEDVISQIPSDYEGIFDLTMCNSIFLGEEVRRRCPRAGAIITVEEPTSLLFRLSLFKHAMKVLASGQKNYLDVCIELREGLGRREAHRARRRWPRLHEIVLHGFAGLR